MKKHLLWIFPASVALAFAGGLYINSVNADTIKTDDEETEKPETPVAEFYFRSFDVPEIVSFAGEPAPIDEFEVRERFDFELIGNVYRNSSTWLAYKRANRYFPLIEPILKANSIPDDFKYLCVIESNLSQAVSPSKAVGFWQFLDKTAIKYGLEVNEEVDERYHVEKATEAACKYLADAYKKFGNWTSAAASYNMGMAGLSGDIAEQQDSNYYNLRLNTETSRYIMRLLATKIMFEEPEKYGYKIEKKDLYPEIPVTTLEVSTGIKDLVAFAKENGTNYKLLKELNPWLRKTYLTNSAGKTYQIKLPAQGWKDYKSLLESMKSIYEK